MENKLYNKELKLAYMKNYDGAEGTKNTILYQFLRSAKIENQYEKDLYAFNDKEIDDLLYSLAWNNIMSINSSVSIYKDYINWCIVNGQRGIYENGENRMEIFQKTEDLRKYISNRKIKNRFLTKEELDDLIDSLANPIDQALILCMYEFIGGQELYELRTLKLSNVNEEDKTVELISIDGEIRVQNISTRLIELLKDANDQKRYIENNGIAVREDGMPLNDTGYVFRVVAKGQSEDIMSYAGVYTKINAIKRFTGYDLITPNSLKETRIMHEISDVAREIGLLDSGEDIYKRSVANIYNTYKIELSRTQMYNIKQKYEQLITLKDFNE